MSLCFFLFMRFYSYFLLIFLRRKGRSGYGDAFSALKVPLLVQLWNANIVSPLVNQSRALVPAWSPPSYLLFYVWRVTDLGCKKSTFMCLLSAQREREEFDCWEMFFHYLITLFYSLCPFLRCYFFTFCFLRFHFLLPDSNFKRHPIYRLCIRIEIRIVIGFGDRWVTYKITRARTWARDSRKYRLNVLTITWSRRPYLNSFIRRLGARQTQNVRRSRRRRRLLPSFNVALRRVRLPSAEHRLSPPLATIRSENRQSPTIIFLRALFLRCPVLPSLE